MWKLKYIFSICLGKSGWLHKLFEITNQKHDNLKCSRNVKSEEDKCQCQIMNSLPFLDTLVSIQLVLHLYTGGSCKSYTSKGMYYCCPLRTIQWPAINNGLNFIWYNTGSYTLILYCINQFTVWCTVN